MTPLTLRILSYIGERDPAWVSSSEIYAAFPRTPVRKRLNALREIGVVEEAAYTLTSERGPGWMYDLRVALGWAPDDFKAYEWLGAVRITQAGRAELHR